MQVLSHLWDYRNANFPCESIPGSKPAVRARLVIKVLISTRAQKRSFLDIRTSKIRPARANSTRPFFRYYRYREKKRQLRESNFLLRMIEMLTSPQETYMVHI